MKLFYLGKSQRSEREFHRMKLFPTLNPTTVCEAAPHLELPNQEVNLRIGEASQTISKFRRFIPDHPVGYPVGSPREPPVQNTRR